MLTLLAQLSLTLLLASTGLNNLSFESIFSIGSKSLEDQKPQTQVHMGIPTNDLQSVMYANEADEDLELEESSDLQKSLSEFTTKGGTLIRMEEETPPFQFEVGDVVFPSCSGANNRSQTLWGFLRSYDGISLQLPHATRYGFDPYNGKANWNRTTHHVRSDDEFLLWAGVNKSTKLGWNVFDHFLLTNEATADDLALMTEYYNTHYYNPNFPSHPRRIYITFAKNAHAHLHRLNQTNSNLENVFVLFFPIEDLIAHPLPEWDTPPRSFKAYQKLASMLEKYLDCSRLQSTLVH